MSRAVGVDDLAAAVIVPVVTIDDAATALDLADALALGGLTLVEITLRTSAGLAAIAAMSTDQRLIVGAGTVLDPEAADRAADAGARFIVSPGIDPDIIERARARSLLPLPGIATPSEAQLALRCGVTTCKFFPAEPLGGIAAIRALAGPFGMLRFVPSGGIDLANATEYVHDPAVIAVCGSWMVPTDALSDRDWPRITRLCRETVDALRPRAQGVGAR